MTVHIYRMSHKINYSLIGASEKSTHQESEQVSGFSLPISHESSNKFIGGYRSIIVLGKSGLKF